MKKLVVVTRNMFSGGAERVVAQLVNFFDAHDVLCSIVTIDNEKVLYEINNGVGIIPIGRKSSKKALDKLLRYKELRRLIKQESPDIVLSMPEDIGIYVILALLGLRIPVYVSERNNPWVMPDVKVTRFLRRLMYPFAKGIVFQTECAKSFFPESIQRKGIVLNNPVDASRIPDRHMGEREKVIVGVGRLSKQKNFELLINAFRIFVSTHPDYRLIIYGEGPQRKELENLIASLKLGNQVDLPGRKQDVLKLMNDAAMFVLSSDYEGMPNVLLEAMCMGMPVIATDCMSGGPRQVIRDGENGLLVKVGDIDGLVDAMNRCADQEFASRLGDHAYTIRQDLTSENVFREWQQYLFEENS